MNHTTEKSGHPEPEHTLTMVETRRALDAEDWDAFTRGGSSAVAPVIDTFREAVQSGHWRLAYSAIHALGRIGGADAATALKNLLSGKESMIEVPEMLEGVRKSAAKALGEMGDPRSIEPLVAALRENGNLGAAVAEALGRIGNTAAVGPLVESLSARDWMVVSPAAEALGRIGDSAAVKPLIEVLRYGDNSYSHWRIAAARALGQIGDPAAIVPLAMVLQCEWKKTPERNAAGEALASIGSPSSARAN